MRGKAFLQKNAETLLVVENKNAPAFQNVGGRWTVFGENHTCVCRREQRLLLRGNGKINGECRSAGGKDLGLNVSAMLANDGHADTEPKTGAAARAFRGVERVEDTRERFRTDANSIILNGNREAVPAASEADLDAARFADFADGLFGVGDQIQKNLNELVGVADNAGKIALRSEIHFDVVAAKGVFLELERALDEAVEVKRSFQGRSGA